MSSVNSPHDATYRHWFPWLDLFRAGGLAIGWPQLGISFVAVAVFVAGLASMDWVTRSGDWNYTPPLVRTDVTADDAAVVTAVWLDDPWIVPLATLAVPWNSVAAPIEGLVWQRPAIQIGPMTLSTSSPGSLIRLLWSVAVWSLFGTAICRAVAVEVARDRSETLPNAVRFAWPRWLHAIGAPSIPAGAILAIASGLIVVAWFGRLPLVGTPLLTVLSPLLLVAGIAVAFLTFVIVLGWPLMVAVMGLEDCDGFGALSRTYSFLTGRPFHAAWNLFVSAVYGGVLVALAGGLLTFALLALANVIYEPIGTTDRWQGVIGWSHFFARWLLLTFSVSLFWSLATLNCLLLRREVDRKPFEDIAAGPDEPIGRSIAPVVGIPATDLRPEQREQLPSNHEAEITAP